MNKQRHYYSLLFFVAFFILFALSCKKSSDKSLFVIGGYTSKTHVDGLHLVEVDFKNLVAKIIHSSSEVQNPSYLIASKKNNRLLYAVCENSNYKGHNTGSVAGFSLENTRLSLRSQVSSEGDGPCHLCFVPRYNRLMIANYNSGSVVSIDLDAKGNLTNDSQIISHYNSSINELRQTKSHAHFVGQSLWSKNIAYSVDLGGDKIYKHQIDRIVKVVDSTSIPNGYGPRHLAFHPKKKWIYSVNELNSTVSLLKNDENSLKYIASYSTLSQFNSKNYPAAIQIDTMGKYLYVSNRGENTISCFSINSRTGALTLKSQTPVNGDFPRFFTLTKDGRYMLVANQKSNNITFFRVNLKTGTPKILDLDLEVNAPSCVLQL